MLLSFLFYLLFCNQCLFFISIYNTNNTVYTILSLHCCFILSNSILTKLENKTACLFSALMYKFTFKLPNYYFKNFCNSTRNIKKVHYYMYTVSIYVPTIKICECNYTYTAEAASFHFHVVYLQLSSYINDSHKQLLPKINLIMLSSHRLVPMIFVG